MAVCLVNHFVACGWCATSSAARDLSELLSCIACHPAHCRGLLSEMLQMLDKYRRLGLRSIELLHLLAPCLVWNLPLCTEL
eukprot:260909-Amphidinium_carterae.1